MDKRLLDIYVGWEVKLNEDEWYFNKSFKSITEGMSSEEAYNYIPNVIEVLFELEDDYLLWETLNLLINLYYIADTTQIHPYLENNWTLLKQHVKKYEDSLSTTFKELMSYLRLKS